MPGHKGTRPTRARGRKKPKPRKPGWRAAFLAALRQSGNVSLAADAAGLSRSKVYDSRATDPAFAAEWDAAIPEAGDRLKARAMERAIGSPVRVFHQGKRVFVWVDPDGNDVPEPLDCGETPASYLAKGCRLVPHFDTDRSDPMLLALLKALCPKEFRENARVEHAGDPSAPVAVSVDVFERIRQLMPAVRPDGGPSVSGGDGPREPADPALG